jgi:3-(methylthio)propionyl---CoA ligase
MQGLMMQEKLLISSIIRQAAKLAPQQQIVSRRIENGHSDGAIHRYSYRDCYARTCRLAHALRKLDVQPGDRIGTLAWNGYRHVELYYAISGIGAVVHTINPRLFAQQIEFIVNHAEDSLLFVDLSFVPLLNELADSIPTVKRIVLLCDEAHGPADARFKFTCYESLLDNEPEQF